MLRNEKSDTNVTAFDPFYDSWYGKGSENQGDVAMKKTYEIARRIAYEKLQGKDKKNT